ncbi:MAG TPA: Spy/CpxP family protein refolding chaperone [Bacteroidales bacterium]|nr:Spy/CpxP family protein refolding chaperone [Bacteroidales bacterium]
MKTMKLSFVMAILTAFSLMGANTATYAQCNKRQQQLQGDQPQQQVSPSDDQTGLPRCCPGFIQDLTPEQGKQIDALHQKFMKEELPLNNLMKEKKAHLITVSAGDNADIATINKTIDEIYGIKAELAKKKEALKQDVRKLLNDEQKLMFDMHHSKGAGKGYGKMQGMGCEMGMNAGQGCGMQQGMGGQGCHMGQKKSGCGMQQGMDGQGCNMGQKQSGCGMQQGQGKGCCKK